MDILIHHAEPADAEALHRIYIGPRVVKGTLQLPYQSAEGRRKHLAEGRCSAYPMARLRLPINPSQPS